MSRYTFGEEEIMQVEKILINWNRFCDQRRKILENFDDNIEVQACPWSWKTTLLVAKIFLLAQKIDFSKESICILTHTNVAVDEIKKKIKVARDDWMADNDFLINVERCLKYPNYIWTLQSFIDKYLAIPWYIKKFWKRPNRIDDDYSIWFIKKWFHSTIDSKTRNYISQKGFIPPIKYDYPKGLEKFLWVKLNPINNELEFKTTQSWVINLANKTNDKYIDILKLFREKIAGSWLLTFDEANLFAKDYLEKHNLILRKFIQRRFSVVFLDEIQDTQWIHIEILNTLFYNSSNLIQWFWDKNQAILENNEAWILFTIFNKNEPLDSSRRLSIEIANSIQNCAIIPQALEWIESKWIPIYFYLYTDSEKENLINFYKQKIIEHNLHIIENWIFKIIGRTHDWIKEYNSNYIWKEKKKKDNFIDYFKKIDIKTFKKDGFKLYKDEILEWIVRWLNILKIKNWEKWFTKVTFVEYIKKNDIPLYSELLLKIYLWSTEIINNTFSYTDKLSEIKTLLWKIEISDKKLNLEDDYFKNWATPLNPIQQENREEEINIDLIFDTIHWVKWETHTWTLLLDIKAFTHETNNRILEYIENSNHKSTEWSTIQDSIKLYYVWITRATHLLVIWLNKSLGKATDFSSIQNKPNIHLVP